MHQVVDHLSKKFGKTNMIEKIVRYTIDKKNIFAVRNAVALFLKAIKENEPQTVYRAYESEAGTQFFHYMSFPDKKTEETHRGAEYTKQFVKVLYPLCLEGPIFEDVHEIDVNT
jgi:quinol monooxygenase YgiN